MSNILRVPSFKANPGTVQTYDADIGADPFGNEIVIPITTRCPEWQDEDYDWTGRTVQESKKLPWIWGPASIKNYFDPYHFHDNQFIEYKPPALFEQGIIRKPKCIIFCNYALSNGITSLVNKWKNVFKKHEITVFKLADMWPTFAVNGLPVQEITLSDPTGVSGLGHTGKGTSYEMPTLLDKDHFRGGKVMVISDFDELYKGNYGFNYFPYYPNDLAEWSDDFDVLGQIADCITSFDKINNYIYFFCSEGNGEFYQGVLDDNTTEPDDYFNIHVYANAAWRTNQYNLAKDDLDTDIADFFGVDAPP